MTKRGKLIAALLVAVGIVVVTPLAAFAYWAVTAQIALTAQAATFSIAPFAAAPASAASSTSFTGWASTQYYSAPLVNNGATPWASQSVAVAAASGFGPSAAATLQVAFSTTAAACQSDATYSSIGAQSALAASTWSSSTVVAPGATVSACIKLAVTDTDSHTIAGQAAPAPTLTLTTSATVAQRNWTDAEQATLAISSTGWASCASSGNDAVLTLPAAVAAGTYTVTRNDTGASFSATVSGANPRALTVTNPARSGTENAETYVTVKNSAGATVATARLSFRSAPYFIIFFQKSVVCA